MSVVSSCTSLASAFSMVLHNGEGHLAVGASPWSLSVWNKGILYKSAVGAGMKLNEDVSSDRLFDVWYLKHLIATVTSLSDVLRLNHTTSFKGLSYSGCMNGSSQLFLHKYPLWGSRTESSWSCKSLHILHLNISSRLWCIFNILFLY